MTQELYQKLIDDIVTLSKNSDEELQKDILSLINLHNEQTQQYEKVLHENKLFLEKLDRRNILANKKDAKKDKLIEQQSRLAAMGEMIDAVAHQWKQPLNAISLVMEILQDDYIKGEVNQIYMKEVNETVHLQIEHMITTLNEFRSFLRPSTRNEDFYIIDALENIKILMKDELISQNINLILNIDTNIKIYGNKNELKHLFINLINNSIDAFNEKEIQKRNIYIKCYQQNNQIYIEIEDNAGGIPQSILNTLFDANVTTKKKRKGTGIGLYMSAQIVKKNNGSISVHNSERGAFFTITLQQPTI
ncbi:MAG: HAMP domain-containing sensor histidine kinase [Sulfurimonas sp.]|jgi:signal transduction histidine kinase